MLLSLIPPPALAIPEALQSHSLAMPTPAFSAGARQPLAYTRLKKALAKLGITMPSVLAADRALWLSTIVEEVRFDIECLEVAVEFVDGTVERIGLSEEGASTLSQEYVVDSQTDELQEDVPAPAPRQSATPSLFERLRTLSLTLRDAWEDVSLLQRDGVPLVSSDDDMATLITLAANPCSKLPDRWRSHPSEIDESDEVEPEDTQDTVSSASTLDPVKYHGQLHSRRRLTSTIISQDGSASPPASQASYTPVASLKRAVDVESFVDILEQTRHALVDLFSSEVLPVLRERLPPTFGIWAAANASKWCQRKAILGGEELAQLLTQLMADDGDDFDPSESEESDFDSDVSDGRLDEMMTAVAAAKERRREGRSRANVMYELRDDWDLKRWCKLAEDKAQRLLYDGPEHAPCTVKPWAVDRPYPAEELAALPSKAVTRSSGKALSAQRSSTPPTSPPAADEYDTDVEHAPEDDGATPRSSRFFYPPDPLGFSFLPARLPRRILEPSTATMGEDTRATKRQVARTLNVIAGLQKKVVELELFISEQATAWDIARADDRETSLPHRRAIKKDYSVTPLILQRLRLATADKTIANRLSFIVSTIGNDKMPFSQWEGREYDSPGLVARIKTGDSGTRKRQISNLALLGLVGSVEDVARSTVESVAASPPSKRKASTALSKPAKRVKSVGPKNIRGVPGKRRRPSLVEVNNRPPKTVLLAPAAGSKADLWTSHGTVDPGPSSSLRVEPDESAFGIACSPPPAVDDICVDIEWPDSVSDKSLDELAEIVVPDLDQDSSDGSDDEADRAVTPEAGPSDRQVDIVVDSYYALDSGPSRAPSSFPKSFFDSSSHLQQGPWDSLPCRPAPPSPPYRDSHNILAPIPLRALVPPAPTVDENALLHEGATLMQQLMEALRSAGPLEPAPRVPSPANVRAARNDEEASR